ncbi:MAG: 30S ribosomal protein S17 [Candidatus Omnitrophica bacterium]|nr:30S ribosomal protein S17 [Candidatus Omnitrophota bacterium]
MQSNRRPSRKERVGIVVSDKMDKTITVEVDRAIHHPIYNKMVRSATKFKVHDEKNSAKAGDTVRIEETRPLSKTKRWRLVEILNKKDSGISGIG